ncbi:ABC transporter permease [Candidatus Bathyarchaeota archaeon]|nr:MAG: ABC transporter permease [Candidatus Bathyarchaeota archaeon]
MSLRAYILKRIVYTIVLVLFVIIVNWFIFQAIPGVEGAIGSLQGNPRATSQQYQHFQELYGLNKSPLQRFEEYFWGMLTFNFGNSFVTQHPVIDDIVKSGRLANTVLLLGTSTVLGIVIGILFGVVVSARRGSGIDTGSVTVALTTFSLPVFWMGLTFIAVFSYLLHWFPPGKAYPDTWFLFGNPPLAQFILTRLQYLFLPMLVLTLFQYGGFLLLTRATMLETLSEDYVTTARAKGLKERTVLFKHAFKNASLPLVTASALGFGTVLGGAILTETVFNWNGLGLWLYNSIIGKDFPVMQAMFYILALSVIIANFIADLIYGIIDPRIRYE